MLCLVQYDNRFYKMMNPALKQGIELNQKRCAEHGQCKHVMKTQTQMDLPPYWAKVQAVREVMDDQPDCATIMWLDSDAVVSRVDAAVSVVPPGKSMVISGDIPPWEGEEDFNAGVWVAKNTAQGRALMDRWMAHYPADKWKKSDDDHSWTCSGAWAGVDYEQGSFRAHLMTDEQVHKLDWRELQSPYPEEHPNSIAFHFAAHHKEQALPAYLHSNSKT